LSNFHYPCIATSIKQCYNSIDYHFQLNTIPPEILHDSKPSFFKYFYNFTKKTMDFRTTVEIPDFLFEINHKHSVIFTGSCFAENIGEKMRKTKINTSVNPTGIHYNPISLSDSVKMAISGVKVTENDLFFANGLWNHFNFHSRFSATDSKLAVNNMNFALESFRDTLKSASYLFVTFGTSFIYENIDTGKTVTNCHKLPPKTFNRRFVNSHETVETWQKLSDELLVLNSKLNIVFTVSPVRHFKDGAINNTLSKSALFLAIKDLMSKNKNHFYFPAYEIVMDELRDYRFFADDMLHPSTVAIDYIWEKFNEAFFSKQTAELNKKIEKIINASKHRVFNSDTDEHRKFCASMLSQIAILKANNPDLDFSDEEHVFGANL
jgi:hypothetical protein